MKKLMIVLMILVSSFTALFSEPAPVQPSGSGTLEAPYQVATLANLYWITQNTASWSAYFEQTADIDASGTSSWDSNAGWTPIGNNSTKFTGSYDGQNHVIHGLYVDRGATDYIGFIGYSNSGTVANLSLTAVDITGHSYTGSIIGAHGGAAVSNCITGGSVTGTFNKNGGFIGNVYNASTIEDCSCSCTVSGSSETGGFFGYVYNSTVTNCSASGNVTGTSYCTGGFSGNINYGVISYCHSSGTVTGTDRAAGFSGASQTTVLVQYCYSTGNVTGSSHTCGGFIGANTQSDISNCYSTGDVSGTYNIGGLIGQVYDGTYQVSTLSYCYSTGLVSGTSSLGGLVGDDALNYSEPNVYDQCFWDTETSGRPSSAGGTGKTTLQMTTESTFTDAGWDFSGETTNGTNDYWTINASYNGGYPYLTDNPSSDIPLPISLVFFTAVENNGTIELSWETATETNNANFVIYRNDVAIESIAGAGTTTEPHNYSYVDNAVVPGVTYTYVLADVNYANEETKYEDDAVTVTVANDLVETDFVVGAAYPNPFNPTAVLPIELSRDVMVTASLYDLNGRKVKVLVHTNFTAGTHDLLIDGAGLTTGLYLVQVVVDNVVDVQKIAMMK